MFPFGKKSKHYWRNRYAYDNTATYKERDSVWYSVGGVTYWYGYQGATEITGVTPDTADMGWVRLGDITETPVRGIQGIQGIQGDEPTDARLNALISQLVLEPSDARLNTLIAALVASLGLQNDSQVNVLIQTYLQANAYRTDAMIRDIINEAYANVLAELGAIQVEYANEPSSESDWSPDNTLYDRVRIRLNNPDADWHIILLGQRGGGETTMAVLTFQYATDTTDSQTYHNSPRVSTDTAFRWKVDDGDFGDWIPLGMGGTATDPKGQLIATATIPTGDHFADDDVLDWALATGIPAGFSTRGAGAFSDSELLVPTKRVTTSQRGWLAELVIDGTIEADVVFDFGLQSSDGAYLDAGSGEPRFGVNYITTHESEASFNATFKRDLTVAATDTIELKLYILQ